MQIVQLQLEPVLQTLQGTYIQHQNDYTLAFWPTYVSKEKAAQRLISALKTGIGDARFDQAAHEIGEIALILTAGIRTPMCPSCGWVISCSPQRFLPLPSRLANTPSAT